MKRSSIGTTITLSTNTKTTNIETDIKTSLKRENIIKYKTPKILNTFQKNYININFHGSFSNFSSNDDFQSSNSNSSKSNSSSKENSLSDSISSKKSKKINANINKHNKISQLPYYIKDKENWKLHYINEYIKSSKLPKYSSDFIGVKLKKEINFPNIKIFNKKVKTNLILSQQKKFKGKKIFLNKENKFISFGFYIDKDIIEKSKELNEELIENDTDMDCESDDDNIMSGINMCLYDIQRAILEVTKNSNSISYIKKNKTKEDNKLEKKCLISFLILALVQVVLYIPWLMFMMGQVNHVRGGFWIVITPLETTVEVLSFQFRRQLETIFTMDWHTILALVASIAMYVYIGFKIYRAKKEKQDIKPGIFSLIGYAGVILLVYIVSKIMTPILFARYLLVMTGLYAFTLAYFMATEKRKYVTYIVCGIVLILGIVSNVEDILINYSSTNLGPINYIKEEIKEDDIIVYSNIGNGGVVAANFPENKQYFLNFDHWDVVEAYKAYGPGMETVESYDFLKEYKGRIWLIDSENMGLYDNFPKENTKILKQTERFDVRYHDYIYNVMLLEKE